MRLSLIIKMSLKSAIAFATAAAVGAAPSYDRIQQMVMDAANATIIATPNVTDYPSNGYSNMANGWSDSKYNSWTSGFFPGLLWKIYNLTSSQSDSNAPYWLSQAVQRTWPINPEQFDTSTHDVGFMVYYTFGIQYQMTGNQTSKAIALRAAASLATRFVPVIGAFRSWGSPNAQHTCETIADNMINLELLFWAGQESGNTSYITMAKSHADKMITDLYQPFNPGCAWHLITYNDQTGAILNRSSTPQGLGLDTVWSRGQAWTINGYAIAYRYTQQASYLVQAQAAADCFIRLTNLCCGNDAYRWMPLWDFNVTSPDQSIDTTAAMIASSGMIEMASQLTDSAQKVYYLSFAYKLIVSALGYWTYPQGQGYQAVLANGTVTFPLTGIPIIYGDYYLMEAWTRWSATPVELRKEAIAAVEAQGFKL